MTGSDSLISWKIFFAVFLIAMPMSLFSQKREMKSVVLRNGSRITGTIISDSSDYIILKIVSPQVVTLNKSDVSITTPARKTDILSAEIHGYSIRISASVLAGRNSHGNNGSLSFHFSNGYRFRNGISAGLGAGIEELDVLLMPVYADIRYHLVKKRISPFVWIKSGYAFPVGEQECVQYYYYGSYTEPGGGFMFNTGTGLALYSWQNSAVSIGIGYRYQKISSEQVNPWIEGTNSELVTCFNRIEVQLGIIFR